MGKEEDEGHSFFPSSLALALALPLTQETDWGRVKDRHRLFTVPYFSVKSYMPIVEFDGPPSWSLDASETGILYSPQIRSHRETKMAARRTQRSASTISRKNRGL